MQTINITNKTQWNQHLGSQEKSQFLQSYEWGEFQKSLGRKVRRLGVEQNGKLVGAIQVIKHDLPLGKSYLYAPRVVTSNWSLVTRELQKIAKQENSIFIRIELVSKPPVTSDQWIVTKPVQPQTTLYLNLTHSEEEILSAMRQKTRYNIRLAEKHEVKIKESSNINEFLKLNRETSKRDKFKSHTDEYYCKMFKVLGTQQYNNITIEQSDNCRLKLFTAYYKDKPLSTNIVIFFGDTATYLHGASSNEYRNLMAPHLLQWEIIKYAKSQNYKWYDFWGINPSDKNLSNPSWQGITRFKRGFVSEKTGQEITYPNCYDLIFQPKWYKLYKIAKYLKI